MPSLVGSEMCIRDRHKAMGCICFENEAMGIYFIADPDGYWLEIVPARK